MTDEERRLFVSVRDAARALLEHFRQTDGYLDGGPVMVAAAMRLEDIEPLRAAIDGRSLFRPRIWLEMLVRRTSREAAAEALDTAARQLAAIPLVPGEDASETYARKLRETAAKLRAPVSIGEVKA